ncbi:MAG: ABC transporter permease, partial [Victivallales bacterium]|nr:ABC transporter permease [Victivallales bacterium]
MHLPLDIFLSLRYLRPKRTFISVISLLSILGPLLGVAILIIVSSVMAGFDRDIRTGIMNMSAHLTLYPLAEGGYFADPQPLIAPLESECAAQGLHAAPVIEGTALVQLRQSVYPKVVRGILPEREKLVTKIQENFSEKRPPLEEGEAAIGRRLAVMLNLKIGDEFLIHSPAHLTENISWTDDGKVEIHEPDEFYLPE